MTFGKDVKALTVGKQQDMYNYLNKNLNQTQYVVMFCHEQWQENMVYKTLVVGKDPNEQENDGAINF